MALFFFVVGLEIKREVLVGEMRHPRAGGAADRRCRSAAWSCRRWSTWRSTRAGRRARLGRADRHGHRLCARHPRLFGAACRPVLLVFLTAFAIVDDILAVGVIAIFYTESISIGRARRRPGACCSALLVVANRAGFHRWPVYAVLGLGVWLAVLEVRRARDGRRRAGGDRVPARSWINPSEFLVRGRRLLDDFEAACYVAPSILTNEPQQQATHALDRLVRGRRDADDLLADAPHAVGRLRHPAGLRLRQRRRAVHHGLATRSEPGDLGRERPA